MHTSAETCAMFFLFLIQVPCGCIFQHLLMHIAASNIRLMKLVEAADSCMRLPDCNNRFSMIFTCARSSLNKKAEKTGTHFSAQKG